MKDVIIKCDKGEVKKTLAYIEKKDRKVKWATGEKPTGWGSLFERKGVYLVIGCDVLTFIETDLFEDSDKNGKTVVSANKFLGKSKNPAIVIFRRDRNVIAKNVATGDEGVAKCSPTDEFCFKTGASIALARLMAKTPDALNHDVKDEWIKVLDLTPVKKKIPLFKVGDMVTLKPNLEPDKRYGTVTLLSGEMTDKVNHRPSEVVFVDPDSHTDVIYCLKNGYHYSEEMLEKWDESKIHEGDTVKVINTGLNYSSYPQWVGEHISDPYMAARYCYGSPNTEKKYKVIKIAEHESNGRMLAYIEECDGFYHNRCYLIEVKGLEKA